MTLLEQMSDLEREGRVPEDHRHHRSHPEESRTPELCSELARAYNNAADVDDKEMYEKALSLLLPYEEHFQGITTGISVWLCLLLPGQEGQALHYFRAGSEARPGDERPSR